MSSLDPELSNEEVHGCEFGHTKGDNFDDANNGEDEDGTTGDQEVVRELRAGPS